MYKLLSCIEIKQRQAILEHHSIGTFLVSQTLTLKRSRPLMIELWNDMFSLILSMTSTMSRSRLIAEEEEHPRRERIGRRLLSRPMDLLYIYIYITSKNE